MRRTAVALLAVVAVAASGCSGEDADAPTPKGDPDVAPEKAATTLRYGIEAAVHGVAWHNDTYSFQEACNTGGCTTGDMERRHDVTDMVPAGVPVHLRVEFEQEPPAQPLGPNFLFADLEDGQFYHYEETQAPGSFTVDAVLRRDSGEASVTVFLAWPGDPPQAAPYTLRIETTYTPDEVPPGAPTAFEMAAGETVAFHAAASGPLQLLVVGPDDALLVRHAGGAHTTFTAPEDMAAGEVVVLPVPGGPPVNVNATRGALRPLALAYDVGEFRDVLPAQPVQWSFAVDEAPVTAGILLRNTPTPVMEPDGPFVAGDHQMTLASPEGVLFDEASECAVCALALAGRIQLDYRASLGDPALVPGEYAASVESSTSAHVQVASFTVSLDRS